MVSKHKLSQIPDLLLYSWKTQWGIIMSIQDRFLEYVDAFEVSYQDDDWSRLAQYFTAEASYDSGDGNTANGREALLEKLEAAVNGLDRAMDSRTVSFQPPTTDADTVVVDWAARYTKAGLPDVEILGREYARFEGDCIAQLWDELDPASVEALVAWLEAHGEALAG
jgi:hypothetical protein